jgi:hypothetical protein
MKGQVSVISIILISGIVIALVGAAYMWGVPLIEKRSVMTEFQTAQNFMLGLNDRIVGMANSGAGRESLNLPSGLIRVIPYSSSDPDNNSIILELGVNQPMVFNQTPVYLGGATFEDVISEAGTYGVSSPGVVSMTSVKDPTGYIIRIKLHFRELDTKTVPQRGYKVLLETPTTSMETGTSAAAISFVKTETQQNACCGNAGPLVASTIMVEVA